MADIARKMQDEFRRAYKGNCERDFDMFEDPDGTLSHFTAYRGIYGGMVVCQVIREPDAPGGRMNVWFFRRAKSTPIPLVVWGGDVKTKFPKGCLHPDMIEMSPNLMQRRYMVSPQWQPFRVKRPFTASV